MTDSINFATSQLHFVVWIWHEIIARKLLYYDRGNLPGCIFCKSLPIAEAEKRYNSSTKKRSSMRGYDELCKLQRTLVICSAIECFTKDNFKVLRSAVERFNFKVLTAPKKERKCSDRLWLSIPHLPTLYVQSRAEMWLANPYLERKARIAL